MANKKNGIIYAAVKEKKKKNYWGNLKRICGVSELDRALYVGIRKCNKKCGYGRDYKVLPILRK